MKAYVIAPPNIWGLATGKLVDAGLQNPVMTPLLIVSRLAMARGTYGVNGPGVNLWSMCEVHDGMSLSLSTLQKVYIPFSAVANLHLLIFNATALEGKEIAGGSTYYFCANGDLAMGDWMRKAAQALHKYGGIKSSELVEFTPEEKQKVPNPSSVWPSHSLLTN